MNQIGKYTILEVLGQGGMGTVYRAQDPVLGREVALKTIQDTALKNPKVRQRFYTEARSSGQLSHENVTVIHDFGEDQGRLYIVMEMLSGTDLNALIFYHHPLSLDLVFSIAVQICRGLHAAHQHGIIHRDIKPGNIRVLESGRVKIMDFGLARVNTGSLSQTHSRVGTPQYMAPEQVKGDDIDHRVDIFAFGLILYEMLTGERAYDGEHMSRVVYSILEDDLPPINHSDLRVAADLQRLVSRCTAKDPRQRYPHFEAVIQDLNRAATKLRQPVVTVAVPGLVEAAMQRRKAYPHTTPVHTTVQSMAPQTLAQLAAQQTVQPTIQARTTQPATVFHPPQTQRTPLATPTPVVEPEPQKRSAVLVASLLFAALTIIGGISYTAIQLVQADGPSPSERVEPVSPRPTTEPEPIPPAEPVVIPVDPPDHSKLQDLQLGAYITLQLIPTRGAIDSLEVQIDGQTHLIDLAANTPLDVRFQDQFLIGPTHLHAVRIRLEDALDYPTAPVYRRTDGSVLITRTAAQNEIDRRR